MAVWIYWPPPPADGGGGFDQGFGALDHLWPALGRGFAHSGAVAEFGPQRLSLANPVLGAWHACAVDHRGLWRKFDRGGQARGLASQFAGLPLYIPTLIFGAEVVKRGGIDGAVPLAALAAITAAAWALLPYAAAAAIRINLR
jgi:hypothetical protein